MADINILGTLNCVAEGGTLARANQIDVNGAKLDNVLSEKLGEEGNGSLVRVEFSSSIPTTDITSGEPLTALFGKIKTFFTNIDAIISSWVSGNHNVDPNAHSNEFQSKEDKSDIRHNIDTPLISNTEYYLGEISSLNITLPASIIGDMFYLTYNTWGVAFTPTITGTYQGLEDIDWLIPNATYELCGKSNGDTWLIAWKVSE